MIPRVADAAEGVATVHCEAEQEDVGLRVVDRPESVKVLPARAPDVKDLHVDGFEAGQNVAGVRFAEAWDEIRGKLA